MPSARQPAVVVPTLETEPPVAADALSCPRGHGEKPGKFCSECGSSLITPSPPGEHIDTFLSALAGVGAARQEAVSWQPRVSEDRADGWTQPEYDPQYVAAVMAGNPAEANRVLRVVIREQAARAKAGRDVIGPRRGTAWMRPGELAQEHEKVLGASMVPSESLQPRGSAVTTRPLSAAEREAAAFTWGAQPGGGPATAVCALGHEMSVEDSACSVCRSPAFDASAPDPPLPPPLPYPGSYHGR
jgi:hypothetical protein